MRIRPTVYTLLLLCVGVTGLYAQQATITVEKGDTLYSIGREYEVSVQTLIEENGILNPRSLTSGTTITIPYTHKVEKGDTLYSISRKHDISVSKLCEYNSIEKEKPIKIGQVIRIPHTRREEKPSPLSGEATIAKEETDEKAEQSGKVAEKKGESEGEGETNTSQKNSQTNTYELRQVRYEKDGEGKALLWPHNGKRVTLTGKLKGTQIDGEIGDRIVAVSSGKVVWVAPYRGYGELIMIESKDGHIYAYGGNEETFVEVGDTVEPGAVIGRLGINPIERNAKAFFFVYRNGRPIDPAKAPRG